MPQLVERIIANIENLLYGNDWTDNGNGTFTSTGGGRYYSPLDLYLAGFYDSSQVLQMLLIDNPLIDATGLPDAGPTISGTPRYVSIDDVIASEGVRIPGASTSQKAFKTAFILVTRPGTYNSNVLPGIETIRSAWAGRFTELTHGKGTIMNIAPSISIAIGSPTDGTTISGSYVDVKGAVINTTGNETVTAVAVGMKDLMEPHIRSSGTLRICTLWTITSTPQIQ